MNGESKMLTFEEAITAVLDDKRLEYRTSHEEENWWTADDFDPIELIRMIVGSMECGYEWRIKSDIITKHVWVTTHGNILAYSYDYPNPKPPRLYKLSINPRTKEIFLEDAN